MGLLNRFFNSSPRWTFPPNVYIELPAIDPRHNETLDIASRSDPSNHFKVNLFKLSCTCPNFARTRSRFAARDMRRICPHIAEAMERIHLDRAIAPAVLLAIHHGRKYLDFVRSQIAEHGADLIIGFSRESPIIGLFGVINHQPVTSHFNLATHAWDSPLASHEPIIHPELNRLFDLKPRLKSPRPPARPAAATVKTATPLHPSHPPLPAHDAPANEDPALKERLIELETRFVHLERTVESLNEVVTRQQNEIQYLQKRLASLSAQVRSPLNIPDDEATD
jgi:uncharacterized coiled-coil protein SlyX